jgi:hypothetical protein
VGERSSFPFEKIWISVLLILEKEERGEQWIRFPEMHAVQSVYLWYSWLRLPAHDSFLVYVGLIQYQH